MPSRLEGDYRITGQMIVDGVASVGNGSFDNNHLKADAGITRSKLAQEAGVVYPIPLQAFRREGDFS